MSKPSDIHREVVYGVALQPARSLVETPHVGASPWGLGLSDPSATLVHEASPGAARLTVEVVIFVWMWAVVVYLDLTLIVWLSDTFWPLAWVLGLLSFSMAWSFLKRVRIRPDHHQSSSPRPPNSGHATYRPIARMDPGRREQSHRDYAPFDDDGW